MRARSTIALTGPERVRLADYILKSERTVYRVYKGLDTSDRSREAVKRGAQALGYPLPPEPSTPSSTPSSTESSTHSKAA